MAVSSISIVRYSYPPAFAANNVGEIRDQEDKSCATVSDGRFMQCETAGEIDPGFLEGAVRVHCVSTLVIRDQSCRATRDVV